MKGQKVVCPVSLDFRIFICSPAKVVANFVHLMSIPGSDFPAYTRSIALPGISVSTQELLDALAKVAGKDAVNLVSVEPDVRNSATS